MKKRIDILLVERGLIETREKAKSTIMAGLVIVDGQRMDKAGTSVEEDVKIEIKGNAIPYVSRGGLKLEKAMNKFDIDLNNKTCMDIGASTGGFTDCMLQNGASKVFSIDVGYGQLAWKLRQDERVVCLERTNFRHLPYEKIAQDIDFASIDVSFISLRLIIPKLMEFLKDEACFVALVKPQFEAGRENVGKKGVVKDKNVHLQVLTDISKFCEETGLQILGVDYSPIKGPEGNREYLIYLQKVKEIKEFISQEKIVEIIQKSHEELV